MISRFNYHTEPNFQEWGTVYPGHPVVTAAFVLHYYHQDIDKAFASTEGGYMTATGDGRIPGAGDAVVSGLDLIAYVRKGQMSIDEAIEYGFREWNRLRNQGPTYRDRILPGNLEACVYVPKFKEYMQIILDKK